MKPSHLSNFQKSDDGLYRCVVTFGKRRPRKMILTMNKSGRLWTEKKNKP